MPCIREAPPKIAQKAFGHCPYSFCTPPPHSNGHSGALFSSAAIGAIGHPGKGLDPPLRAMPKCLLRYFQWCFPKLPTRENICEMSIVNCLKGKLFLRIAQGNVKSSCRMSTLFHKFMRDRNSLFYYLFICTFSTNLD